MNKKDLVNVIYEQVEGITKKDIGLILTVGFEQIVKAVAEDSDVKIAGFGTFTHTDRAARDGVNPATGEKIAIPAMKTPKFKASTTFKAALK